MSLSYLETWAALVQQMFECVLQSCCAKTGGVEGLQAGGEDRRTCMREGLHAHCEVLCAEGGYRPQVPAYPPPPLAIRESEENRTNSAPPSSFQGAVPCLCSAFVYTIWGGSGRIQNPNQMMAVSAGAWEQGQPWEHVAGSPFIIIPLW